MSLRVCVEPGCPALVKSGRCADHRRQQEQARGSRHARGYGAAHEALRRSYELRMRAGEVFMCWRCEAQGVATEIDPDAWHLGHDDHDRSVYRGPECVPCNTATASRISSDA